MKYFLVTLLAFCGMLRSYGQGYGETKLKGNVKTVEEYYVLPMYYTDAAHPVNSTTPSALNHMTKYNATGQKTEEYKEQDGHKGVDTTVKYTYLYNAHGDLTETRIFFKKQKPVSIKVINKYGKDKHLVETQTDMSYGGTKDMMINRYDDSGHITQTLLGTNGYRYIYNTHGDVTEIVVVAGGTEGEHIRCAYDEQHQMTILTTSTMKTCYKYENYDTAGNWTKRTSSYTVGGQPFDVTIRKIVYY